MAIASVTEKKLDQSAMLINLKISQWTARKLDKKTSAKVARDAGIAADRGSYYKTLVGGDTIAAIKTKANEIRSYHYRMTLPWADDGPRLLPAMAYFEYMQQMQEFGDQYHSLVREFVDEYPMAREEAKRLLGSLFDEADYPDTQSVAGKFDMDITVMPMPTSGDFRVDLSEEEVERVRADITRRTEAVLAESMKEVYDRILKVTEAFVDRLGDEDKVFRNSLVENARSLHSLLPKFNLTNDPKLNELAERMEMLCKHDPDELRKDPRVRAETHKAARHMKKDLMDFLSGGEQAPEVPEVTAAVTEPTEDDDWGAALDSEPAVAPPPVAPKVPVADDEEEWG